MNRNNLVINQYPQFLFIPVLFLAGFISVQRFTLPYYDLISIIILTGILFFKLPIVRKSELLSILCLAIIFSVDNGGMTYGETFSSIRYVLYLSAVVLMFLTASAWNIKYLLIILLVSIALIFLTLINQAEFTTPFNKNTFVRDIQILIILMIIASSKHRVEINKPILFWECWAIFLANW